ncbi:MAG TPA: methylated-DNA--[protein]-cysteine S-methyltransferase [Leucothrix sp.]|nr:methylated-DNA--[protein]-cysteine S-methyltransferase [Leucothrix sp.]
MNSIVTRTIQTPFGELIAGATTKGICLLEFTDTNRVAMQLLRLEKSFNATINTGDSPYFKSLNQELKDYFKGELKEFQVPLDTKGTLFQMQAWDALLKIPYGETRSYLEQAKAINKPKAFRAVASANRNNRISILIPCHRVIAKDGSLAGYGGGLDRKAFLINLERKHK